MNLFPEDCSLSRKDQEIMIILIGLMIFTSLSGARKDGPAWRKGLPPLGGKVAGPWRGKGSLGKGFGRQTRHR